MSEERKKVFQRFQERLAHLESGALAGPAHWHIFHLHNALKVLPDDHTAADLHLDEFDRAEMAREMPELAVDQAPSVAEIRNRFDMLAGGTLQPLARKIEAGSNGRSKITIFPAMQLGDAPPQLYVPARDGFADIVRLGLATVRLLT